MTVSVTWGQMLQWLEKVAAYFALGGVGVANFPALPTGVRSVLASIGGIVVALDRTTISPTTALPAAKPTPTTYEGMKAP
jgi:hypothetical protein